ncbi:YigZ family protein [Sporosarcina gallistercoris]|uniref:YigZ family protein n=1 Tax=Sporosarcina gallistercoris TaxID=2762245 RepID=A0ABR8PLF1_9BACL|nr:YigZ family protein [Sporosarcina gallistercoris]MBD7909005.1 YigZ family protein [Sporosarcina gallistercoris]
MRLDYKTVKQQSETEIIINKSRFITSVKRTETEQEALDFIQEIKQAHPSANHNCSAYLIGEHDQIQKANDDGEPSGTAGFPMLEVLKKQGLKDTTVVITRYFGGIKLGGGGLIRAYGRSTSEGVAAAGTVERILHSTMRVTVDYTSLGKVENEVRQSAWPLEHIEYGEQVTLFILVPISDVEVFHTWIADLTNGQGDIIEGEQKFLEFSV